MMPALAPQSAALYDALATLYDAWQNAGGGAPFSELVFAKLEPALRRWGRPALDARPGSPAVASFVDLGCGTGDLLLSLRRLHPSWGLTGVDASAQMLAVARRKQVPAVADIAWVQAELAAPLPCPPVDAVGAFYDTINHLNDPDALEQMLAAVAQALRPGGLFIFDVTNAVGFDKWWRARNHWTGDGWEISVTTSYRPDAGVAHADVTIVRDGRTPVEAHLVERCFADRDIREALSRAGLMVEVQEPWSPFQIDAPGKTWWITRKVPH